MNWLILCPLPHVPSSPSIVVEIICVPIMMLIYDSGSGMGLASCQWFMVAGCRYVVVYLLRYLPPFNGGYVSC
jgi:hypothetical protein